MKNNVWTFQHHLAKPGGSPHLRLGTAGLKDEILTQMYERKQTNSMYFFSEQKDKEQIIKSHSSLQC